MELRTIDCCPTRCRSWIERAPKKQSRLHPVALYRAHRDAERRSDFVFTQPAEEAALDDARQPWLQSRQARQRFVELEQLFVLVDRRHVVIIECDGNSIPA